MVSIILTSYVDSLDRELNLKMVLECLSNQGFPVPSEHCEVILVLYHNDPNCFPNLTFPLVDLHVSEINQLEISEDKYCLSWLRNIGAKTAKGDKLIFLDDNIVFGDDYLENLISNFDPKTKFLMGWSRQAKLTRLGRTVYRSEGFYSTEWADPYIECYIHAAYDGVTCSPVIFDSEYFCHVLGGYSENYIGEEGSDNDIFTRARFLVGDYPRYDYTTLRLWTSPRIMEVTSNCNYLLGQALRFPLELSTRMVHSDLGKENQRTEIKYDVTLVGR